MAEEKTMKQAQIDEVKQSEAKWYVVHTYSGHENGVLSVLVLVQGGLNG